MSKILALCLLAFTAHAAGPGRGPAARQVSAPPILDEDSDARLTNVGTKPTEPASRGKLDRNKMTGIYDNPEYMPLVDLINGAKTSIDIEIYEMDDRNVRAAIRLALKEHVKVRILKDPNPLGELCPYFDAAPKGKKLSADCLDQRKLVKDVQAAKGTFAPFDKSALCGPAGKPASTCYEHGKIAIIDADSNDSLAMISTGNYNASNLCDRDQNPSTCNRDFTYVTRDKSVIQGLSEIYQHDIDKQRLDFKPTALSDKITVSPYSKSYLINFIRTAKSSIQIENQYMEDPDVNAAIKEMSDKVQVEMMVASLCSFGPVAAKDANTARANYGKLGDKVKLKFFTSQMRVGGSAGYLHAKVIVVDEKTAWIGSVNGSSESMDENREYGVFFNHPDRVHFVSNILASDFDNPNAESLEESIKCAHDGKSGAKKNSKK